MRPRAAAAPRQFGSQVSRHTCGALFGRMHCHRRLCFTAGAKRSLPCCCNRAPGPPVQCTPLLRARCRERPRRRSRLAEHVSRAACNSWGSQRPGRPHVHVRSAPKQRIRTAPRAMGVLGHHTVVTCDAVVVVSVTPHSFLRCAGIERMQAWRGSRGRDKATGWCDWHTPTCAPPCGNGTPRVRTRLATTSHRQGPAWLAACCQPRAACHVVPAEPCALCLAGHLSSSSSSSSSHSNRQARSSCGPIRCCARGARTTCASTGCIRLWRWCARVVMDMDWSQHARACGRGEQRAHWHADTVCCLALHCRTTSGARRATWRWAASRTALTQQARATASRSPCSWPTTQT
jgi:hypothetical protein